MIKRTDITAMFDDYAKLVYETLIQADIRANAYLDDSNMKAKIKQISQEHKTPYILVVGQKEKDENSVCVRYRFSSGKQQETMKLDEFVKYVETKNLEKGTTI